MAKCIHTHTHIHSFFLKQRSALSVAANCCLSVAEEDFQLVADSIPILSNRLQHQVIEFFY